MASPETRELLDLSARLLAAITARDWGTYRDLCDPGLTAFEPEARGQLVEGLDFHRFYFEMPGEPGASRASLCSPRVKVMGDVAVVAYVRLVQALGADGAPRTAAYEETRVWQRRKGRWRHVHFHRSAPAGG